MSFLLAVVAALCFGAQILLVDRGLVSDSTRSPLAVATVVTAVGTAALWLLVLARRGVPSVTHLAVLLPFALAGVGDPGFARLCFYEGIDRVGPAVSSAITAGSPAVAALLAVPALGATVTPVETVGVALVVAGVATIQLIRPSADSPDGSGPDAGVSPDIDAVRRELVETTPRDLLYPVAAMLLIAAAFVVVKWGLDSFSDSLLATATAQTAAFVALVTVATGRGSRGALSAATRNGGVLVAAGLVVAGGWYAMFTALQSGSVVTVLPVVSTYPLVVVVATYAAARELPRSPVVLGAIVAIVVGAAAVQMV